jgi:hypothetical protein
MAKTPGSPRRTDPGSEVWASQSWKWLTERFAYAPQVRLVFDEELPQWADAERNFVKT